MRVCAGAAAAGIRSRSGRRPTCDPRMARIHLRAMRLIVYAFAFGYGLPAVGGRGPEPLRS